MARYVPVLPRRPHGPAVVPAILLAALIIVLSLSAPGGENSRASVGPVSAGTAFIGTASISTARGAEVVSVHSDTHTNHGDPALTAASVRNLRDAAGERPAPPLCVPGASRGGPAVNPLQPARPPLSALGPCASGQPPHRHGVRAPPSPSGI